MEILAAAVITAVGAIIGSVIAVRWRTDSSGPRRVRGLDLSYLDRDYGIKITHPRNGQSVPLDARLVVTGTYRVAPPPGTLRTCTMLEDAGQRRYWPQVDDVELSSADNTWRASVHIGTTGAHRIIVGVLDPSAVLLWDYFHEVGVDANWRPFRAFPVLSRQSADIVVVPDGPDR